MLNQLEPNSSQNLSTVSGISKLKIGINCRYLNSPLSGIERYLNELLINSDVNECEFVVRGLGFQGKNPLNRFQIFNQFKSGVWDRYLNYLDNSDTPIDLFHGPSFILPAKMRSVPSVVTVHDLAFLIYPEHFDFRTRIYYRLFFKKSIFEAKRIICVSNSTASDLIRYFPEIRDRVRVVYNGYKDFSTIDFDYKILEKFNLVKDQFLLCVGSYHPRKNIIEIIKLSSKIIRDFPKLKIVIVGRKSNGGLGHIPSNVIFTGHVRDTELATLYRGARLFIYPSLYEGFGFPILEALSVQTPVVCSNTSCMPEISGLPAEYMFNPHDPQSIYKTIISVLHEDKNANNFQFLSSILHRYSWKKMYQDTLVVYKECLG